MKTTTFYQVRVNDDYILSKNGYGRYSDRLRMYFDGFLDYEEIYGLEQCIEHIAEYLGMVDEHEQKRQADIIKIEKVVSTVETIDYIPLPPIHNIRKHWELIRIGDFMGDFYKKDYEK